MLRWAESILPPIWTRLPIWHGFQQCSLSAVTATLTSSKSCTEISFDSYERLGVEMLPSVLLLCYFFLRARHFVHFPGHALSEFVFIKSEMVLALKDRELSVAAQFLHPVTQQINRLLQMNIIEGSNRHVNFSF